MMAKIIDARDPMFRLDISMEYEEDFPMSGFGKFCIVFSILLVITAMALAVVVYLNREGHIDIYIPKKLRPYCVKDQAMAEAAQAERHKKKLNEKVGDSNTLAYRLRIDPTKNGFVIDDDDFFVDQQLLAEKKDKELLKGMAFSSNNNKSDDSEDEDKVKGKYGMYWENHYDEKEFNPNLGF
jgi:hypothetical protein